MTGDKNFGLAGGEAEARPLGKGGAVIAGQDQQERQGRHHEQGEAGRPGSPLADSERTEPEIQQDEESRKGDEVAGGAHEGPCLGNEDGEMLHDASNSFVLTLALMLPLAVCAAGPGTAGWKHIAVAAGYYCVFFLFSSWAARRCSDEEGIVVRTVFMESRLAIAVVGIAAIGFGSPVLLEIAPDVVAVAVAGSGLVDGRAVGLEARSRDCSVARALVGVVSSRGAGRKASP